MRLRGSGPGELPAALVRYVEADWPGPDPAERWSAARTVWARRARSLDELNELYPVDLVLPPTPDPRVTR